jgi:ferric-dicitrate binding protein FerR (iron transport regulator)
MKLIPFPQKKDPMDALLGSFAQDFPSSEQIELEVADATPEELAEAEAATEAILARLAMADPHVVEPAPRRVRPPIWVSGLVGLAAAAAVAFYVVPTHVGPVDGQIPAQVASTEVIVPLVVPLADGPGLTLQPESIVAKETVTAADGTESEVAVLTAGGLSFERHNGIVPEIQEVRWARLPLVAQPVGTVFDARAFGDVALVHVREGRVDLRSHGDTVGAVGVGQFYVIRSVDDRLDIVDVTDWSTREGGDRVRTLGPEGPALSAAITKIRLGETPDAFAPEIKQMGATRR